MVRSIVTIGFLLLAADATAQTCEEIRFAPGAVSGAVSGQVAEGLPLCFSFAAGSGQTARLTLSGSQNVCFNVRGMVDCQDDFSFRTAARSYEVLVHQLFRGPGRETFQLQLSIR